MAEDAAARVGETLHSGYIGEGSRVGEFETKLGLLLQHPHVLTTNSCTSAIDLALHLIGVGPYDEVITTPMTCVATNSPIVNRGARPVWADVSPTTGLIDPEDVKRKITTRTKAIVGVDWGGAVCDWAWLKAFGYPTIEDAAHAILAPTQADYVCYSFQAIKHLTTGDGGALLCPDVKRARLLRWFGLDRTSLESFRCGQNIREVGYKYHMNDIAASIGLANVEYVQDIVAKHRANARYLQDRLDGTRVALPRWTTTSSWWFYTVQVMERGLFIKHMAARGIAVGQVHRRNDSYDGMRHFDSGLVGVGKFDAYNVAIPCGWWLSQEDLAKIVEAVNTYEPRIPWCGDNL